MGSGRAGQLAESIDAVNLELIQLVHGLSEEQWQTLCNDEGDGRPVGVIAHHVAHVHGDTLDWLETALTGEPGGPLDPALRNLAPALSGWQV